MKLLNKLKSIFKSKYTYQGWKGNFVDAYFGDLAKGEWVNVTWLKYHYLKNNGYIARKEKK